MYHLSDTKVHNFIVEEKDSDKYILINNQKVYLKNVRMIKECGREMLGIWLLNNKSSKPNLIYDWCFEPEEKTEELEKFFGIKDIFDEYRYYRL